MDASNITIREEHLDFLSFSRLDQKSKLNNGSHCEVWRFEDRLTHEFYAVKIIRQEGSELSLTTKKEIENLCTIQKASDRPSCFLIFFGWVLIEEKHSIFNEINELKCCLVFEMATATLADLIKAKRKSNSYLPFEDLYRYTKTLIDGMAFLQGKGITHRDIKPENILIKQDEHKILQIKIADFSESKLDIPNSTLQNMTIKGTPSYLSPELFYSWVSQNELEHNPYRSDVYSLGLTLLELATLEKVLDGEVRKIKETDKNPKVEDHGPFDHLINHALKNFVAIYSNDKNAKNLEPIIKNMLSYQERHRFDFQTLELLLEADRKKNSVLSPLNSIRSSTTSYERVMIPSMVGNESEIGVNEAKKHFSISFMNQKIMIKGTASEEMEKSINEGNFSNLLETIQKIRKIYDFEVRTKSETGPKKWFKVYERLFKDNFYKSASHKIHHLQILSIPSEELLHEQNSAYCAWVYNQCYKPKEFQGSYTGLIHNHQKHWDLGLSDEEAIVLLGFANMVVHDNNSLESLSIVLSGETNLTDITEKALMETLKKVQIEHLKHLRIHLDGQYFSRELDFIRQLNNILFKERKTCERLDHLESLHIGLSSSGTINDRGLKEIIEQQKSLSSLSLFFKNLADDRLLAEMNESFDEGLFVHLKDISIGLHFADEFEPTSIECQLKFSLKKIMAYFSRQTEKRLNNFSFLLQGYYNFEDSYHFLRNIIEIKTITKFEIYWKNFDNGLTKLDQQLRRDELEVKRTKEPMKHPIFYFEF